MKRRASSLTLLRNLFIGLLILGFALYLLYVNFNLLGFALDRTLCIEDARYGWTDARSARYDLIMGEELKFISNTRLACWINQVPFFGKIISCIIMYYAFYVGGVIAYYNLRNLLHRL